MCVSPVSDNHASSARGNRGMKTASASRGSSTSATAGHGKFEIRDRTSLSGIAEVAPDIRKGETGKKDLV